MSATCKIQVCCDRDLYDYNLQSYPLSENLEQTITVPCPEGMTCDLPFIEITVPAGAIQRRPTTSEEDVQETIAAEVQEYAERQAFPFLRPQPQLWMNTEQIVSCSQGRVGIDPDFPFFTSAGTVTIPASTFSSTESLAKANAKAVDLANDLLDAFADCHWENIGQTCTCADGSTKSVAGGQFQSYVSQQDADNQAKAQCAEDCLSCAPLTACGTIIAPDFVQIDNYAAFLAATPACPACTASGDTAFDGTFERFVSTGYPYKDWSVRQPVSVSFNGVNVSSIIIWRVSPPSDLGMAGCDFWALSFVCTEVGFDNHLLYYAEKIGGDSPIGVYTKKTPLTCVNDYFVGLSFWTAQCLGGPATVEIIAGP